MDLWTFRSEKGGQRIDPVTISPLLSCSFCFLLELLFSVLLLERLLLAGGRVSGAGLAGPACAAAVYVMLYDNNRKDRARRDDI